ncbi:uncharacterized protein MKZ38_008307 [Zalerion maritima]|uniref:Uncharacterized protein n=1 Tax=Zalerion maritima TaxID=339359 RepID=A0AAD5RHM2_9PEZI|nr:uncharacterized protein MKZ38_008307 [Zalerion maritima]
MMHIRMSPYNEQPGCKLAHVPQEILDRMTEDLPTPSLGNLRRSCKLIEGRLFPGFAKEFFGKKQFMLTYFSLQTLIDISRHKDISPYVTEIQIGLDRYPPTPALPNLGGGVGDGGGTDGQGNFDDNLKAHMAWQKGQESQASLIVYGFDREMLAEAFSNLPNLTKIVIRDNNSRARHRDHISCDDNGNPMPFRDNLTGQWRSYGASTVDKPVRMDPIYHSRIGPETIYFNLPQFVTRAWILVFSAMASSSSLARPRHVELLLRQHFGHIADDQMNIPDFLVPKVRPVLENLEVLHLRVRYPAFGPQDHLGLQRFLTMTPNLKHLRINLSRCQSSDEQGTRNLIRWLAHEPLDGLSIPLPDGVPAHMDFPHLSQLDLGDFSHIHKNDLVKLIARLSTTLVNLSLHRISLLSPAMDKESHWPSVLRAIGKMEKLHVLSTSGIGQHDMSRRQTYPVHLNPDRLPLGSTVTNNGYKFHYSGNWIGEFAEKAAQEFTVKYPPKPMHFDEDGEEEEDDDAEDSEAASESGDGDGDGDGDDAMADASPAPAAGGPALPS